MGHNVFRSTNPHLVDDVTPLAAFWLATRQGRLLYYVVQMIDQSGCTVTAGDRESQPISPDY